jgi:hypothetical protein
MVQTKEETKEVMKHTQGEWKPYFVRWTPEAPIQGFAIRVEGKRRSIAGADCYEPQVVLVPDKAVQSQPWAKEFYTSEEVEANAYLIAAAPDLLAAAELALEYFDQCVMSCDDPDSDVPEAAALRAAINKALGKE